MADKLTLQATPPLDPIKLDDKITLTVILNQENTLTATLTKAGGTPDKDQDVTFQSKGADGVYTAIETSKTKEDGTVALAFAKLAAANGTGADWVTIRAEAGAAKSDELQIKLFETEQELLFVRALKKLSEAKAQQQDETQNTAEATRKVENLQQAIESLKKSPGRPPSLDSAINQYKGAFNGFEKKLSDSDLKLKQLGESISAKMDKAPLDEITAKFTQAVKDKQALETQKSKLENEQRELNAKLAMENDQLAKKGVEWNNVLATEANLNTAFGDLEKAVEEVDKDFAAANNNKQKLALAYLKLQGCKQSLTEIRGKVMKTDVLEKNLIDLRQQLLVQQQAVATLRDQIQAKSTEAKKTIDPNAKVKAFIEVVIP